MSVASKMALGVVLLIVCVMGGSSFFLARLIERALTEGLAARAEIVATTLVPAVEKARLMGDLADLRRIAESVKKESDEILGIRILDDRGLELTSAGQVSGDGLFLRRKVEVAGRSYGTLEILFSREGLRRSRAEAMTTTIQWTVIFSLAGVLAAAVLAKRFSRPAEELSAAAERVAGGDLATRVEVTRDDEIGIVQRRFNEMVDNIASSRAALERRLNEMTALYEIAHILHSSSDSKEVLSLALEAAETGFGFTKVAAFLNPPKEGKDMTCAAVRGIEGIPETLPPETLASLASADTPRRVASGELPAAWGLGGPPGLEAAIVAPLTAVGTRMGFLVAGGKGTQEESALQLLSVFGSQLAPALHGALLGAKLAERITDPFTPLAVRIGEEMIRAEGFGLPTSLLGLRLDGAIAKVQAEGWEAFDARFARVLKDAEKAFPDAAFVARYGADRAIVVLPGMEKKEAQRLSFSFDLPPDFLASVATHPDDGATVLELLMRL